tara:strand:+ start:476 stop:748 length:273 start_codon:yes stop_codon:yes gene_type:complete
MSKIIFNFGNKTIEKDMNDIKSKKDVKNAFSEVMKKEKKVKKEKEAHTHFVMQEFANLILRSGSYVVFYEFKKNNPDAYNEIVNFCTKNL